MEPTPHGTITNQVIPRSSSRCGVQINDQVGPVVPQPLSPRSGFSPLVTHQGSKNYGWGANGAQSLWDQYCLGHPWVHLRIHGPDFPSGGPHGPTTPTSIFSTPVRLLVLQVSCPNDGYYGLKLHTDRVLHYPIILAIQRLTNSRSMTSSRHPVYFHYTALKQFSIPHIHSITKQ